jgi:hypothetical protein
LRLQAPPETRTHACTHTYKNARMHTHTHTRTFRRSALRMTLRFPSAPCARCSRRFSSFSLFCSSCMIPAHIAVRYSRFVTHSSLLTVRYSRFATRGSLLEVCRRRVTGYPLHLKGYPLYLDMINFTALLPPLHRASKAFLRFSFSASVSHPYPVIHVQAPFSFFSLPVCCCPPCASIA